MIDTITTKYKLLFSVFGVASVAIILWWQNSELTAVKNSLNQVMEKNAELRLSVADHKASVATLEQAVSDILKSTKTLSKNLDKANTEREMITNKLNSYKGRLENAALKRPGFIESRANDAIDSVMHDFEQLTDTTR
jgi:septal ring factor EnvC (AmiA/AmiB activator)